MSRFAPPPRRLAQSSSWVFDLDNTLYPASCLLFRAIERRMTQFVAETLGTDLDSAFKVQKQYFKDHGATMRGLMINHGVDPVRFLDYVHDVDLSPIPPSPQLDRALGRLPGRKLIFTNASVRHSERILGHLGIAHHFEAIFDIVASDYIPKPEPAVYATFVERYGVEPASSIMVEDIAVNLRPAAAMGMATLWVKTDTKWGQYKSDEPHVHHATEDLPGWLDELTSNVK